MSIDDPLDTDEVGLKDGMPKMFYLVVSLRAPYKHNRHAHIAIHAERERERERERLIII